MPPRKKLSDRIQEPTGPQERIAIGLRVPRKDLEEIDRRAGKAGLDRSTYMIRTATGQPVDERSLQKRLDDLEEEIDRRISSLEQLAGF